VLLSQPGFELHICCFRLDDPVPGRLHWPCHANLTLNNLPLPVPCRTAAADLPRGGRDPPAVLSLASVAAMPTPPPGVPGLPGLLRALQAAGAAGEGLTLRVCLAGYDGRPFALCAFVARRLPLPEMRALVPPAPAFAAALYRARTTAAGADAEEDIVMEAGVLLSLRCPLSASRIATPVRYAGCAGMAAFDLDALILSAGRSRCWRCPLCAAGGPPAALVRDPYVAGILAALSLSRFPADAQVETVKLLPCGGWQAQLPGSRAWGRIVPPQETESALASLSSGLPFALPDAAEAAGAAGGVKRSASADWPADAAAAAAAEEEDDVIVISDSEEEAPPPPVKADEGAAAVAPPPMKGGDEEFWQELVRMEERGERAAEERKRLLAREAAAEAARAAAEAAMREAALGEARAREALQLLESHRQREREKDSRIAELEAALEASQGRARDLAPPSQDTQSFFTPPLLHPHQAPSGSGLTVSGTVSGMTVSLKTPAVAELMPRQPPAKGVLAAPGSQPFEPATQEQELEALLVPRPREDRPLEDSGSFTRKSGLGPAR